MIDCCLSFPPSSCPFLSSVIHLPRGSLPHHHLSILTASSHLIISTFLLPLIFPSVFRRLTIPFMLPCVCPPLFHHSSRSAPCLFLFSARLRLARMNEEMREAEAPLGQPGQYHSSSPTEQQYRKCIQEFICLTIEEC